MPKKVKMKNEKWNEMKLQPIGLPGFLRYQKKGFSEEVSNFVSIHALTTRKIKKMNWALTRR